MVNNLNTVIGHKICQLPPSSNRRASGRELRNLLKSISSNSHLERPPGLCRKMPGRSGCGSPALSPCPTAQPGSHCWWKTFQVWAQLYWSQCPKASLREIPNSNSGAGILVEEPSPDLTGRCIFRWPGHQHGVAKGRASGDQEESSFCCRIVNNAGFQSINLDYLLTGPRFPHSVKKPGWLVASQ